jgi:hypothetical protein
MDNRIFNVNGEGLENLIKTLKLCFDLEDASGAKGWSFSTKHGLIFHSYQCSQRMNTFPAKLSPEECAKMAYSWLSGDEAKTVILTNDWDKEVDDYEVDSYPAWRVYCEDWGHVNGSWSAICGILPTFGWSGK